MATPIVRQTGWVSGLIMLGIGVVIMVNGVPALFQWIGYLARAAAAGVVDDVLAASLFPLVFALVGSFLGFLLARGGFGVLVRNGRTSARAMEARARQEAGQVIDRAGGGARELAHDAGGRANAVVQQAAPAATNWGQRLDQMLQDPSNARASGSTGRTQAGSARLERIAELRHSLDQRVEQMQGAPQADIARQAAMARHRAAEAAERARLAGEMGAVASAAAGGVAAAAPMLRDAVGGVRRARNAVDAQVAQLAGRLDAADGERVRRRGSSLTRSSLGTSALSKSSLTTSSLLPQRRH